MIVDTTVAAVPLDADRLPEYAGHLYDAGRAHPQVMRFLMWYHLLRGDSAQRTSVAESMRAEVEAIEQAQRRGTVTTCRAHPGSGVDAREHVAPTRARRRAIGTRTSTPKPRPRRGHDAGLLDGCRNGAIARSRRPSNRASPPPASTSEFTEQVCARECRR
ncbi:hypothetical protein [Nocardia asteroides]|uniref:hypothetical protein n=1 Tax=Nocardia asteroides TaxID=1824 RepID=UPI003B3ADECA